MPLLEVATDASSPSPTPSSGIVAAGTALSPESRIERAEVLRWMFFEQHALEPNIGAAYFWLALVRGGRDLQTHALEDWMERGYAALQVMENHLKTHRYFAAGQLTVADIALYGYTHVADRCDFDLATFPAIRDWLRRVEQSPGFVPMDWPPEVGRGGRRLPPGPEPCERPGKNSGNSGHNRLTPPRFRHNGTCPAAMLPGTAAILRRRRG